MVVIVCLSATLTSSMFDMLTPHFPDRFLLDCVFMVLVVGSCISTVPSFAVCYINYIPISLHSLSMQELILIVNTGQKKHKYLIKSCRGDTRIITPQFSYCNYYTATRRSKPPSKVERDCSSA